MSFLFKRKSIFLFVFCFILFSFLTTAVFANTTPEPVVGSGGAKEDLLDKIPFGLIDTLSGGRATIAMGVAAILSFSIMGWTGMLLSLSALFFNITLDFGVTGISDFVNGTNNGASVIKDTWLIFRNIANIGLIFALIFIAIQTILRTNGYNTKKLLGSVVIAGILMNFSFFITALVVDVSNEMSITIYNEIKEKITGDSSAGGAKVGTYFMAKSGASIVSLAFLAAVDPNHQKRFDETNQSFWGDAAKGLQIGFKIITNPLTVLIYITIGAIAGSIVNLIFAFVLFAAGGMVLGRLIAILILLVISPIAFVSMVLPKTEKISNDWKESLIGQCFFLPAFLLFILIAVQIIEKVPLRDSANDTDQIASNYSAIAGVLAPVLFKYAIIAGLLIAAMTVAKKISKMGGETIGKITANVSSSVTGAMGGAALGSMAFLGRNTAGMGAEVLSKNKKLASFARSNPLVGGAIMKQLEGIAKSSFDMRNTKTFKGVATATGVGGDMSKYFKPPKDGFRGQTDRLAKTIESTYKAVPDADKKEVESEKNKVEETKQAVAIQEEAMKDLKKQVAMGQLTTGHSKYTEAEKALKDAKDAQKTAAEKYAKAKNPAKYEFIEKANTPSSNPIVNVWIKPAQKKVAENLEKVLKEKEGKDEKNHKELVKALDEIKKSNKSE